MRSLRSSSSGDWSPLCCELVLPAFSVLQKPWMYWRCLWYVHSKSRSGRLPLMRLFEKWIVERVAIRQWIVVVHMMNPTMPFWRYSVTIRASNWKIIVVLNPSSLVVVCKLNNCYVLHQNTRSTCFRIRPFRRIVWVRYCHPRCEYSWLLYVLSDTFEPSHQTLGISRILE